VVLVERTCKTICKARHIPFTLSSYVRPLIAAVLLILSSSAAFVIPVSAAGSSTATAAPPTIFKGGNCCYAGYSGNISLGSTITKLTAEWKLPAAICQPGLGGPQQLLTLIQLNILVVGVRELCQTGSTTPSITGFAYFPPTDSNFTVLPVKGLAVGDLVQATILINLSVPDQVQGKLVNLNVTGSGKTHVETVPTSAATAQGFIIGISRGLNPPSSPLPVVFLAKFTAPIKFGNCIIVDKAGKKFVLRAIPILTQGTMIDESYKAMAKPSSISGGGKAFSVTFVKST